MTAPATVEVVYIAFGDFGPEPVRRFLASYRDRPAGHAHLLRVALKRQPVDGTVAAECRAAGATMLDVPDGGFDIGTYFYCAARSSADLLCLLNTNSVLLGDDWLAKLVAGRDRQGGGAVGATGSWESVASDEVAIARRQGVGRMRAGVRFLRRWRHFPAFPNPHLRTNGLLIAREALLALGPQAPGSKEEAFRFESGRRGLSARLCARGLPLKLVGRDGRAFAPADWDRSETFWQGEQANLLIGDNQTLRYRDGDATLRAGLRALAWNDPRRP